MTPVRVVVASYLGRRRSGVSGYDLLSAQVRCLARLDLPQIDRFLIVINGDHDPQLLAQCLRPIEGDSRFEVILRDNQGFSYGAWNHAIIHSIVNGGFTGHFFLIEDDYCIIGPDFLEPFFAVPPTAYVCQLVFDDPVRHAAVSNGLLHGAVARNVLIETGNVFSLEENNLPGYHGGEHIQKFFLAPIAQYCVQHGLRFLDDVSAHTRVLYFDQNFRILKHYGHALKPAAIIPYEHLESDHGHSTSAAAA